MKDLLIQKFSKSPFDKYLKATSPKELIEGNFWHDNYWGACYCKGHQNHHGQNHLGKLLMEIRDGTW